MLALSYLFGMILGSVLLILPFATKDVGVETGITAKNINDSYISDCTIETDQIALIPDSYIDITAEKIRIYKELDSTSDDRSLEIGRAHV